MTRARTIDRAGAACLCFASAIGCGASREPSRAIKGPLENVPLVITEVAQGTFFDGTTGDKVEVFCTSAAGCPSFKVCDPTSGGGTSCSALHPTLAAGGRIVVSRGNHVTNADPVWLADGAGAEFAGTRVGPFPCVNGESQSRADCSVAVFAHCGAPTLGLGSGSCLPGDFPEPFVYSVRFATNQHGGPESTCDRPVCQELMLAIDAAQTSVDFAIYGIRAQSHIIDALASAEARGVVVRGVVDSENGDCTAFGYSDTPHLIGALTPGSVHCDVGGGYTYIMHNKFFVLDGHKVWTGSTNVSDTELGGEYNSDVTALITSYRLAAIYQSEFDEMYGAGLYHRRKSDNTPHVVDGTHFIDGTILKSYFSPTDHARDNAVIPLVSSATSTLDIAMFYFTSQEIADAIVAARARGVIVRMIIDAGGAGNAYSKHAELCAAGIPVKIENWGGKSHAKWAVADAGVSDLGAVVFGSMNWTGAGDADNDENTLYVKNSGFAASFHHEFERQWTDLAGVPPCTTIRSEGADSSSCPVPDNCSAGCTSGSCCDGLDNDYDGKVDLAEESCGCRDGVDNDRDGYVDQDDWDCRPVHDPD
jgi:phosphatidylserine/phosphatidylglycerophosphate/cardiolipin synthase-like enzyme